MLTVVVAVFNPSPAVACPAVRLAAVPVMFVPISVDGVPRFGVTSVGLSEKTTDPVPVFVVIAASRFALDGVVKNVEIPDARTSELRFMATARSLASVTNVVSAVINASPRAANVDGSLRVGGVGSAVIMSDFQSAKLPRLMSGN